MSRTPDYVLLELEEKLLALVDVAWEQYESSSGGFPPPMLTNLLIKAHDTISKRMQRRLGGTFDPNNPEATLLEIKKIEAVLLRQIEQKHRLRAAS